MNASIETSKDTVRRLALLARSRVPPEAIEDAARDVATLVAGLPEIERARLVLAFASFGRELPTDPLLERLLSAGKTVVLPYVDAADGAMRAAAIRSLDDLVPGYRGIREPAERLPAAAVEAAVVPGVAFDARGGRLGYGGGFYDRYLEDIAGGVPVIGVCFDVQVVDEVPVEAHDRRVDIIATERRVIRCR